MEPATGKRNPSKTLLATLALLALASIIFRSRLGLSGHMDEYDYLFVGKTLLAGGEWPTLTYIFGSDFNWYLLGWSEKMFGGLSGARTVPALFGAISLVFTWLITHRLWKSSTIATVATLLLALSAPHIHISRLATYDIISFTLFTASLYALLLAFSTDEQTYKKLFIGVLLFAAAVFSKYVVLLFIPVVGGLMLLKSPGKAVLGGLLLGSLLLGYFLLNKAELLNLYQYQIVAVHGANADRIELLLLIFPYLALPVILWTIGFISVKKQHTDVLKQSAGTDPRINRSIIFASLVLSVPLTAYHFYGSNLISLYKHSVYTVFFLTPVSAWVLTKVIASRLDEHVLKSLTPLGAICLTIAAVVQLQSIERAFPDMRAFLNATADIIEPDSRVLSEDPYLFRYSLFGKLEQSQINEIGWFDFNQDGVHESRDVIHALEASHFDFVYLNDQIDPDNNDTYRKLLEQHNYRLVYTENYSLTATMTKNRVGSLALYQRATPNSDSEKSATAAHDL